MVKKIQYIMCRKFQLWKQVRFGIQGHSLIIQRMTVNSRFLDIMTRLIRMRNGACSCCITDAAFRTMRGFIAVKKLLVSVRLGQIRLGFLFFWRRTVRRRKILELLLADQFLKDPMYIEQSRGCTVKYTPENE